MDLSAGVVDVWWAQLGDAPRELLGLLDDVEQERLAAYRQRPDRVRFVLGSAMLRLASACYLGVPASSIMLDRSCPKCGGQHGKVAIVAAGGLQASVTHSGDVVGVAFAIDAAVGLDAEVVRGPADLRCLEPDILSLSERAHLAQFEPARRRSALLRTWTRKEAVLKATGDGLSLPMNRVVVAPPDAAAVLLDWADRPDIVGRLQLTDLICVEEHVAALAVVGSTAVRVRERPAATLFNAAQSSHRLQDALDVS